MIVIKRAESSSAPVRHVPGMHERGKGFQGNPSAADPAGEAAISPNNVTDWIN